MKLQVKLAIYNALSKAVVVLAIGLILPIIVQTVVYNHIDKRLRARADKVMILIQRGGLNEIKMEQDCSFESFNILKEEFVQIVPLLTNPVNGFSVNYTNETLHIESELLNHRVLKQAFMFDNQFYELTVGEGLSAVEQLNRTINRFTLIVLIVVLIVFVFFDLYFARLALKPLNMIISKKLIKINSPTSYDFNTIPTNTSEFKLLNSSLDQLMHSLKQTFQNEREFIGNVSHELLTPLSILQTRFDNIVADEKTPEPIAEKLIESQKSIIRLTKIIRALLLISKIENKQYLRNDSLSLKDQVNEVLSEVEERIEAKKITIENQCQIDLVLHKVNRSLIHNLFFNLINNAIKYNKQEGSIIIKSVLEKDFVELSIKDSGVGMNEEELDKIFDRFKRFHSGGEEGYGLGMPIVKTICDFHGIEISFLSSPNHGTEVLLKIPVDQ
ncbi:MAG TPA: HAMP domain-containing sensor histidine kinase [Bacteroidia bacterium]|nr:HAMP domain-containing sensor histidine kinase [Bacteroidia bacterium]HNT80161.1 HAMP domain-containing sensor histidine kinase [Bacteroidia bacterium]